MKKHFYFWFYFVIYLVFFKQLKLHSFIIYLTFKQNPLSLNKLGLSFCIKNVICVKSPDNIGKTIV